MIELERIIKRQNLLFRVINELENILFNSSDINIYSKEILRYLLFITRLSDGIILWRSNGGFEFGDSSFSIEKLDLFSDIALDVCVKRKSKGLIVNRVKRDVLRKRRIFNFLVMPIVNNRNCVGCILLFNKKKGFTRKNVNFIGFLSRRIGIGYGYISTFLELNLRLKELRIIYDVDKIRDNIMGHEIMIKKVLEKILEYINGEFSFFMMYDSDGNLKDYYFNGIDYKQKVYDELKKISDGVYLENKKGLINKEIGVVKNALVVPVSISVQQFGVLGIVNNTKVFKKHDLVLLEGVVSQLDTAVFDNIKRKRIKSIFQRYVSPDVVEELLQKDDGDYFKVKRRVLTILFSDLRGFTEISENLEPELVVEFLNEHFEAMSKIILKYGGMLDKIVGDQLMVVFGTLGNGEHVVNALKVALEMQRKHEELLLKWKQKGIDSGLGIGINSGEVLLGNIGCDVRSDYTVIGDNVNIASRLCSEAERGEILVTKNSYDLANDLFVFEGRDEFNLKGKRKKIGVFNLLKLK
ncbi:MAG TPA: adenylate/guanylate cyclase domain-containing protein [Candidatus Nanoarchaeia archaeon]|nr:adenylate/guanylate cyclase domain-containing protein [Candidatus Nanoarchaeia archaeon]